MVQSHNHKNSSLVFDPCQGAAACHTSVAPSAFASNLHHGHHSCKECTPISANLLYAGGRSSGPKAVHKPSTQPPTLTPTHSGVCGLCTAFWGGFNTISHALHSFLTHISTHRVLPGLVTGYSSRSRARHHVQTGRAHSSAHASKTSSWCRPAMPHSRQRATRSR